MKFFREKDDRAYQYASMQARIFERSSVEGLNSYDFIMAFMHSKMAFNLDIGLFEESSLSEREIYAAIKKQISNIKKKTEVYPENVMHWIGFFYRYASFLTMIDSVRLFKKISPKYLYGVYPTYHSLEISKAVSLVMEAKEDSFLSPNEKFIHMLREPDSNDEAYLSIQEIIKKTKIK